MRTTCVVRDVSGVGQYIPLSDAVRVNPTEPVFVGDFNFAEEKDGPSDSNLRKIGLPVGTLQRLTVRECGRVLRDVNGITQWVPMSEVPFFNDGERVFFGNWSDVQVNSGPSGSHRRTISTPSGAYVEKHISLN